MLLLQGEKRNNTTPSPLALALVRVTHVPKLLAFRVHDRPTCTRTSCAGAAGGAADRPPSPSTHLPRDHTNGVGPVVQPCVHPPARLSHYPLTAFPCMGTVPVKGQDLPVPLWHGASSTRQRAWQGPGTTCPGAFPSERSETRVHGTWPTSEARRRAAHAPTCTMHPHTQPCTHGRPTSRAQGLPVDLPTHPRSASTARPLVQARAASTHRGESGRDPALTHIQGQDEAQGLAQGAGRVGKSLIDRDPWKIHGSFTRGVAFWRGGG